MIQYEDIDRDDMINYWGRGVIFLCKDGNWNAYKMSNCTNTKILLELVKAHITGDPDEHVEMSYGEFFEKAMLHRPPLGVLVRKDGGVFALGWQHANGNEMAKGIRTEDIFVEPLGEDKPEPKASEWPKAWADAVQAFWAAAKDIPHDENPFNNDNYQPLARTLTNYQLHPLVGVARMRIKRDGQHDLAGVFVLEFLNQPRQTVKEALAKVDAGPQPLGSTLWMRKEKGNVTIMNGPTKVAGVSKDTGQVYPLQGIKKMHQLVGEHVTRQLA